MYNFAGINVFYIVRNQFHLIAYTFKAFEILCIMKKDL